MGFGDRFRARNVKKVKLDQEEAAEVREQQPAKTASPAMEPVAAKPEAKPSVEDAFELRPATPQGDQQSKAEGEPDLFSSIFGETASEEATPRSLLIESLPEVSPDELLDELEELREIMWDWYLR